MVGSSCSSSMVDTSYSSSCSMDGISVGDGTTSSNTYLIDTHNTPHVHNTPNIHNIPHTHNTPHTPTPLHSIPIILTGDLNASPEKKNGPFNYESRVYPYMKLHPLHLRSVMNDDVPLCCSTDVCSSMSSDSRGTSVVSDDNSVSDSCTSDTTSSNSECTGSQETCDTTHPNNYTTHPLTHNIHPGNTAPHTTLPTIHTTNNTTNNTTHYKRSPVWTSWKTRWKSGQELIVKHCIDYIMYSTCTGSRGSVGSTGSGVGSSGGSVSDGSVRSIGVGSSVNGGVSSSSSSSDAITTTITTTTTTNTNTNKGYVSIHAVAALDTPSDTDVGPETLPSAHYPSDHISLVADFQVLYH